MNIKALQLKALRQPRWLTILELESLILGSYTFGAGIRLTCRHCKSVRVRAAHLRGIHQFYVTRYHVCCPVCHSAEPPDAESNFRFPRSEILQVMPWGELTPTEREQGR